MNTTLTTTYPGLIPNLVREYGSIEAARDEFRKVKSKLEAVEPGYKNVIIFTRYNEIRSVVCTRGWDEAEKWTEYNNHVILWQEA